ncbi:carbohydrate-binding module family 48 protein [Backusella circina FSU 941]|nr:carbohydrate-binding module family 48 protein [Backusella circina FSU 941]
MNRKKKTGSSCSSSSSCSLNTTTPIEPIEVNPTEKEYEKTKMNIPETKEEQEDEGVHLYPMNQSCSNSIISTIESDHPNFTPRSSLQINSLNKVSSKHFQEYLTNTKTIKICWNHGGKKVQVTGEFDNWSAPIDMIPDTSHSYHVHLPFTLNKDMEFKFMVDGEWRYADDLPHRTDKNGNINNVIYMESANVR